MQLFRKEKQAKPDPQMIPLGYSDGDDNPVFWNLGSGQTAVVTPENFDRTSMFASVIAHAEQFSGQMEWCAYDLKGDMFSDFEGYKDKTAHDLEQAWKLSLFLGREIAQRVMEKKTGKTVIVLINDGKDLFKIKDPDRTDLYIDMLDAFHSIVRLGPQVGVYVLLQSTSTSHTAPELQQLRINGA